MSNSDNKINIGNSWKDIDSMQINIGDVWKDVAEAYINIGDSWKQFWTSDSVIKVETFDVNLSAASSTHTLTNDVGATSSAFIRINNSSEKPTAGPTGSTGDADPRELHAGAQLTDTDTITFTKYNTTAVKTIGEVWRYTGSAGGNSEFIVRGHYAISIGGSSASQAVSNISNEDDCVPIMTGLYTTEGSTSDFEQATFAVSMDGSGNVVVSRNNSGTTATVYVSVIEFTGSNWSVGHGVSHSHNSSLDTVTLNTDSTGTGGSTFDVVDWETAWIEGSMGGDSSETGISDCMVLIRPGANTTTVVFSIHEADSDARNDGDGYIHVIQHDDLIVKRANDANVSEGNGSYGTVSWPSGSSTEEDIENLALEWFVDSGGTGSSHAKGRLGARITTASGTIQHWVHRSGNIVHARYGVINLSNIKD